MKHSVLLLLIAVSVLGFSFKNSDVEISYFVQFKIETLHSNDEAMLIDQKMKSKSGIKISRTDYITSTYFCVLKPGVEYTRSNFETWFSKLGYEIKCFNQGIQAQDKSISPHILKNCTDEK